jgi:cytochrome c oxidase cbb3-type subunit 1
MLNLRRDNSASTNFIVSAAVWLVLGTLMGLVLAIEFVFPDFARGIPWLVFGRLRQAHVNTVLFAWLSGGMMGCWLYMVPRLTGRKIWSELLGNFSVIAWNVSLLFGILAIMAGHTQGREYAEFIWVVDVAVMVVLITNAVNVLMTIKNRVEP